ncbi:hypothetical protein FDECE_17443 [Fusarium decemcellulare]|nr:hypothetical protein FDECE_17443 [Fusarium decemcellulare]
MSASEEPTVAGWALASRGTRPEEYEHQSEAIEIAQSLVLIGSLSGNFPLSHDLNIDCASQSETLSNSISVQGHPTWVKMQQSTNRHRRPGPFRRRRIPGTRAQQACLHCKDKKLKVIQQQGYWQSTCLVLDAQTKKSRPRNYLEVLEGRVASLKNRDSGASSQPTPAAESNDNSTPSNSNPYTPEGRDGASDLSSRVGVLDFRSTQTEPQYLGSSSSFAFSRVINLSLTRDLPVVPTLTGLNNRRDSSPSPCLLPEYDVAVTLSNAYFKHIHPQYPFLHEPTFRAWEAMLYDSSQDFTEVGFSSSPLFFLNMVYAVAALLLPNTQSLAEVGLFCSSKDGP